MGYQGMRHFVARGEMLGVAVLVVIGVTLLALTPQAGFHEPSYAVGVFSNRRMSLKDREG